MLKQLELIESLKNKGVLRSELIFKAFQQIDRADFVLEKYQDQAYLDIPLPIGYGQTISQPYTVAFMLELLDPQINQEILDIGCGSGYTTALLAEIVKPKGKVYGLEIIPDLIKQAKKNLTNYPDLNLEINLAEANNIIGCPDQQFDRILVSAAAKKLPEQLLKQLKKSAKLVVPINHSLFLYEKDEQGKIKETEHFGFSFVPLV